MSAHISIAKAAFGASLLRPDVTKVSRDELPIFHNAFDAMLLRCSSRNIQTCKEWLLENVVVSTGRTAALGKYLVTISRHLEKEVPHVVGRQRLHILYLMNDLLHHTTYHGPDNGIRNRLTQSLQPSLVEHFELAFSDAGVRVSKRLTALIQLWEREEYYGQPLIVQLRDASGGASAISESIGQETPDSNGAAREPPYLLPPTHGDDTLPYYDLPAGNLMHHIVPNSSQPLRPSAIRALQLSAGPADESLVNALKDFMQDVDSIDNSLSKLEEAGLAPGIDELGQISYVDETGDIIADSYYGWSRAFCEKMKNRGRQGSEWSPRRSRSQSTASDHNVVPRKRRRRSSSSRGRSRSSSLSGRSRSRPRYGGRHMGRSRSRSRSKSRSYSPKYSPLPAQAPRIEPAQTFVGANVDQGHPPYPPSLPPGPLAPIGLPFPPGAFVPTGLPVPPPRPPHWTGPWPPPPPPPPSFSGNAAYPNLPFPAPPPPPPSHNQSYLPGGWPHHNAYPGQNSHSWQSR